MLANEQALESTVSWQLKKKIVPDPSFGLSTESFGRCFLQLHQSRTSRLIYLQSLPFSKAISTMVAITTYGILLALSAVSVQATQAVPVASLASETVPCEPVMHVVLEGNQVTIYDPAIHGEGAQLRLFEKYTSPCVNGLKLSYNSFDFSPRTDIQSRSASDLAERGIFSWALSKLFWAGVAGVTGGIFGAVSCGIDILKHGFSIGSFACVATSVFGAVGGGFAT
jgi:hypothetical protein